MINLFFRFISFSIIVWLISYLLYVLPIVYYLSLVGYSITVFSQCLTSVVIAAILFIYLQTKITFFPLKFFVYFGMAVGFYGLIITFLFFLFRFFVLDIFGVILIPFFLGIILIRGFINAQKIDVKQISIESDKVTMSHRIAFISDVHLGSQSIAHLNKIMGLINDQDVDALLIGGDLIDSSSFDLTQLDCFSMFSKPIYFVTGNHEYYLKDSQNKLSQLNRFSIKIIDNKTFQLNELLLIGLGDNVSKENKYKHLNSIDSAKFKILMVHRPSLWPQAAPYCDLMLSGHTHAGQMFPFHLLVKLQFPYYYGLYNFDNSYAYVSSGVGCWGPRIRLGSMNEIVVITIDSKNN